MLEYTTPDANQPAKLPFYARLSLCLLTVVLLLFLLRMGRTLLIPLFFSILIAFLLLPLAKFLERRKIPRGIAALLALLLFICGMSAVFYLLGSQISDFARNIPVLQDQLINWIAKTQHWIAQKYNFDVEDQTAYVRDHLNTLSSTATVAVRSVLGTLLGFVIWTIFTLVFTFFILTSRDLLRRFISSLFRPSYQGRVNEVMSETRLLANAYVSGLLLEMVIVAAANCLAFWIFGIRYALLLGILAAVLNIVPYLGIYTGIAITVVVTLSHSSVGVAFTAAAILLVVHFLDANVLLPRLVGSRVKVNPLITIVVVILGEMLWGIAGMFLFIPLAGMLKIVFERVEAMKPWALLMDTNKTAPPPVAPAAPESDDGKSKIEG